MIAGNIANANTPGFRAQAVQPFAEVLDKTSLHMVSTDPSDLAASPAADQPIPVVDQVGWETTESGNTVSLEQELIKAGDVHRDFSLNTAIVKAFHGMLMASVKS